MLLCLLTASAEAFELRLWPLLEVERHPGQRRVRALGPLLEWRRTPHRREWIVRPLFHWTRQTPEDRYEASLLYPALRWEGGTRRFASLFGLLTFEAPPRAGRRFTLFPLVFWRERPDGRSSLAVLPFYADLPGFFGYDRVQSVLFPLWLRLSEGRHRRTWIGFPFLSRIVGPGAKGLRLWPIYGYTRLGRHERSTYVLWPLYVRRVLHPEAPVPTTHRISWPLFTSIESPTVRSRAYSFLPFGLLPLYTHTVDRDAGTETFGFPWPFWILHRDLETGERRALRFAPFWGERETPSLRSRFFLWPLYRWRRGLGADAGYEREDVLVFLYRDRSEGEGAIRRRTRVLFPLVVERHRGRDRRIQGLTSLDGILPGNPELEEMWAPLVRLWGWEERDGERQGDVLWGMFRWGPDGVRPPLFLSTD